MSSRLFFKVFISFWLVTVLQVAAVIIIPNLLTTTDNIVPQQHKQHQEFVDMLSRSTNLIDTIRQIQHQIHPPLNLRNQLMNNRGKLVNVFIVDEEQTSVDGRRLPKDIYLAIANHEEHPNKNFYHFKRWSIYGPYDFTYNSQHYQLYVRDFKHHKRAQIINFLTENPLITLVIVMCISAIFCGLLAWHIARPIRSLDATAKRLASGDLTARSNKETLGYHDEIGQLASSFNDMADALESMIKRQQRLLGDISHEIRTPLTRLQLVCAIHRRQVGDNDEIKRIAQETELIDKMLNQLLALSRSTLSNEHPIEEVNFSFFMENIIDNIRFEANEANITFTNSIDVQPVVAVQWDSLASAIENILRNAIRYTKQTIEFTATAHHDELVIEISDDGCGVADEHLDQLFSPFYRVSSARERDSGGTGLGLAIAHEAVIRHRGRIKAENNDQGGLTVIIALPLALD